MKPLFAKLLMCADFTAPFKSRALTLAFIVGLIAGILVNVQSATAVANWVSLHGSYYPRIAGLVGALPGAAVFAAIYFGLGLLLSYLSWKKEKPKN